MDNRRTGRSTRLLEAAKAHAKAGYAVYIVVASEQDIARWTDQLEPNLGIKVETAHQLRLNWTTLQLPGQTWPNVKVFVDHYAIEQRFDRVLQELHRYDEDAPSIPAPKPYTLTGRRLSRSLEFQPLPPSTAEARRLMEAFFPKDAENLDAD